MTSNPRTIDAEKSVAYAAKVMQEEELIGMLTDRDTATRVAAEGRDPRSGEGSRRGVEATRHHDPQQDLDEALRMMAKASRLVGVVRKQVTTGRRVSS